VKSPSRHQTPLKRTALRLKWMLSSAARHWGSHPKGAPMRLKIGRIPGCKAEATLCVSKNLSTKFTTFSTTYTQRPKCTLDPALP